MANADVFLEKYKQLEEVVRSTYRLRDDDSISYYLNGQVKYQRYRDDIKYCQDVRNVLSHKKKVKDQYAVEPSQEMIVFLEKLIEKVKNRTRCHEIQIGVQNVYWQSMSGNVKAAMMQMRAKMFTHIPIMENGVVIGVFDENSVFNYLADDGIIEVSDELTFEDIKTYLSLEGREMEEFIFFPPRNTSRGRM